jgi:hypothetical protein
MVCALLLFVSLLFVGRQLGDTKRQMKGADGRC